jgi:hypothetical protein
MSIQDNTGSLSGSPENAFDLRGITVGKIGQAKSVIRVFLDRVWDLHQGAFIDQWAHLISDVSACFPLLTSGGRYADQVFQEYLGAFLDIIGDQGSLYLSGSGNQ